MYSAVLIEILKHTTAVYALCTNMESSVPKLHIHVSKDLVDAGVQFVYLAEVICHTFPIHVSIDLFSADAQFIVLVEVICHTIPLHVLICSTDTLPYSHIKPKSKLSQFMA